MELLPDEAKGLPPPDILNRNSAWFGLVGWFSAMLHNGLNRRPALRSGVHRQLLLVSIGWFLGYHITKYENYTYARLDRDMREYIRLHPDEFQQKDKRTYAEVLEKFYLKLGREMLSAVKGNL
ncbi:NADH dehydrogenase [Huso huso]|uniref:NADH dehydrogenase [ubiquinone] 1 subunit C2 n=1 Tax=Huso huso TaxID=61971 RepID=A0ABR0ZNM3_HUSHU